MVRILSFACALVCGNASIASILDPRRRVGSLNAECELTLMTAKVDRLGLALRHVHDFARRLSPGTPTRGKILKKAFEDAHLSAERAEELTEHVWGAELWRADRLSDARIGGFTEEGVDQIRLYQDQLRRTRELVTTRVPEEHQPRLRNLVVGANGSAAALGVMSIGAIAIGVPFFAMIPPVALAVHAGLNANEPYFAGDKFRDRFDQRLERMMTESRPGDWAFSTRTYRLNAKLIDAIWAGDDENILRSSIAELVYPLVKTLDGLRRLARLHTNDKAFAEGYVVIDRLAEVDRAGRVFLSVVVRTSHRPPARVLSDLYRSP